MFYERTSDSKCMCGDDFCAHLKDKRFFVLLRVDLRAVTFKLK